MLIKKNTKQFGMWAESFVAQFLKKNGFEIIDRNYKKQFGEIDIIAQKSSLLVFVEVKARVNTDHVTSHELVVYSKQKKIILTAKDFLMHHENFFKDTVLRFDVAVVHGHAPDCSITYIANAFQDE